MMFRCSLLTFLLIPTLALADAGAEAAARADLRARFGPEASLIWDAARGVPAAVMGLDLKLPGKTATARAQRFLTVHGALLGIDAKQLGVGRVSAFHGRPVVRFQQTMGGVPVEGRYVALSFDKAQRLLRVSSDWMPLGASDVGSMLDEAAIRAAVATRYPGSPQGIATRVIVANAPRLARTSWRVPVALVPPILIRMVWVDGETGRILQDRLVGKDVPGEVVR